MGLDFDDSFNYTLVTFIRSANDGDVASSGEGSGGKHIVHKGWGGGL